MTLCRDITIITIWNFPNERSVSTPHRVHRTTSRRERQVTGRPVVSSPHWM